MAGREPAGSKASRNAPMPATLCLCPRLAEDEGQEHGPVEDTDDLVGERHCSIAKLKASCEFLDCHPSLCSHHPRKQLQAAGKGTVRWPPWCLSRVELH